ncbi:hypothetical protein JJQ72_02180 [Paenibacillus sp. F411]|uniref:hypothetical protein n=1 Tax=Paenibacillus sp. F411 TaxID=2820239 RepID=UPI001AAEEC78|nr:hypothetical protein [Paenibacillus sp. F411]MBO2942793.1 hypothetical protein [Paenibacillus sp. F411]
MYENDNKLLNDFIRQKAFPIVLDELLAEHEEEKIDLVLNGLEYTYKEDIRDESKILVYFDVLRELRVEVIKKLITYTDFYMKYWSLELKPLLLFPPNDKEGRKKYNENQGYLSYIDNQLETLGLTTKEVTESLGEKVVLTDFGEHFIQFFDLKTLIKIPAE